MPTARSHRTKCRLVRTSHVQHTVTQGNKCWTPLPNCTLLRRTFSGWRRVYLFWYVKFHVVGVITAKLIDNLVLIRGRNVGLFTVFLGHVFILIVLRHLESHVMLTIHRPMLPPAARFISREKSFPTFFNFLVSISDSVLSNNSPPPQIPLFG